MAFWARVSEALGHYFTCFWVRVHALKPVSTSVLDSRHILAAWTVLALLLLAQGLPRVPRRDCTKGSPAYNSEASKWLFL